MKKVQSAADAATNSGLLFVFQIICSHWGRFSLLPKVAKDNRP